MTEGEQLEADGKRITLYRGEGENLPVIYSNDYMESGKEVRKCCEALSCPPFHLVTVSGLNWDSDLSPWPSEPVVSDEDHFEGRAAEHLKWILDQAVPAAEKEFSLQHPRSYIAGYSMAGLFSLWTLYQTDFFSGAVSASGSVWYPGFSDYASAHELKKMPAGIYLSLGNKESRTANPFLRKTETIYRNLEKEYAGRGIPSVFEMNPGNHYRDVCVRMAKGITWLMGRDGIS
jgi:predicted alpha/beta superfamily hydrolase